MAITNSSLLIIPSPSTSESESTSWMVVSSSAAGSCDLLKKRFASPIVVGASPPMGGTLLRKISTYFCLVRSSSAQPLRGLGRAGTTEGTTEGTTAGVTAGTAGAGGAKGAKGVASNETIPEASAADTLSKEDICERGGIGIGAASKEAFSNEGIGVESKAPMSKDGGGAGAAAVGAGAGGLGMSSGGRVSGSCTPDWLRLIRCIAIANSSLLSRPSKSASASAIAFCTVRSSTPATGTAAAACSRRSGAPALIVT